MGTKRNNAIEKKKNIQVKKGKKEEIKKEKKRKEKNSNVELSSEEEEEWEKGESSEEEFEALSESEEEELEVALNKVLQEIDSEMEQERKKQEGEEEEGEEEEEREEDAMEEKSEKKNGGKKKKKESEKEKRQRRRREEEEKRMKDKEYASIPEEELVPFYWELKKGDQPKEIKEDIQMLGFQLESLSWMSQQEEAERWRGGILADDMGMGKTLQAIAMILNRRSEEQKGLSEEEIKDRIWTTLVVTPVVAIQQWKNEILKYTKEGSLKVCIYHGSDRPTSIQDYDVVITSYSTVEAEYRYEHTGMTRKNKDGEKEKVKKPSTIHSICWNRIILDEAHSIKDRQCQTARSVFHLEAKYRWSLTGTPLQNRVDELFSLIKFMRITPYSFYYCKKCDCKSIHWNFFGKKRCDDCGCSRMVHFAWWNRNVMNPIIKHGITSELSGTAYRTMKYILQHVMLRRTKEEKKEDLCLPPRLIHVRKDEFDEEENDFYEALYTQSKTTFNNFVEEGTILSNYAHVFDLLLRLRQAANHPYLVLHSRDREDDKGTDWCKICHDPAEDPIASKCKHVFCRSCVQNFIQMEEKASCPVCFAPLTIDLEQRYKPPPSSTVQSSKGNQKTILQRVDLTNWKSSTKIDAVLEELTNIKQRDPCAKTIIFSQFVNFLDLIDWRLTLAGFGCVKLDGRMSSQQKEVAIQRFNKDPNTTVFLVSLKAGGIALNLTIASYCFLLDPWWNPAAEFQAVDRIYRLGQFKCVRVYRFLITNSIEERIIQLQEKKHLLFHSTIGMDQDSLARLSLSDLKFLFK
eukprot:TRINITY_DN8173_c0_g1_i1.p1 TRINITY_DN8173_c0_g1~~TRINITY_DN8173_c0_g1_i1.p1  ORF type:complete len:801 (+),score=290.78 TRINITY_DN8173_c0_g1_i1:82-2484(+)